MGKDYAGNATKTVWKYTELAWKYLHDKGWWVYIIVGIAVIIFIAMSKTTPKNPFIP